MSKRTSAKYKISRRLGVNLWGRANDPSITRNYPPGQHGQANTSRKPSDYGNQLRAKQQLRSYYGNLTEKQFRRFYQEATRKRGDSGENLVGLLERRLDVVIYRANFVPTVFSARQFVNHKHITVNGKIVKIPSYLVKVGDIIEVRQNARQIPMVLEALQKMERSVPDYLDLDGSANRVKYIRAPKLADIPYPVVMEPNLVIEFYSR
jgi:small subunit ribosomal protein S4